MTFICTRLRTDDRSLDDAMAEAVRLLLRNRTQRRPEARPDTSLGSIGAMRDAADELDTIVADVYRKWQGLARPFPVSHGE